MKKSSILFYIISVLFYVTALVGFVSGTDKSMDIVWLGLIVCGEILRKDYKVKELLIMEFIGDRLKNYSN